VIKYQILLERETKKARKNSVDGLAVAMGESQPFLWIRILRREILTCGLAVAGLFFGLLEEEKIRTEVIS
jgi:hypothetical protein